MKAKKIVLLSVMWSLLGTAAVLLAPTKAQAQLPALDPNFQWFSVDVCFVLPRLDALGASMGTSATATGDRLATTAGLLYPEGTLPANVTDMTQCPDVNLSIGTAQNQRQAIAATSTNLGVANQYNNLFFRLNGGTTAASRAAYTGPLGAVLATNFNNSILVTGGSGDFADTGDSFIVGIGDDSGLRSKWIFPLKQRATPAVAATPNGPAVTHSNDFSLVSATKPAVAGELLSIFATSLGPTTPGVRDGTPFPASPLQATRSRVGVLVNGRNAQVLSAVAFPGSVDGYQVDFRVPADAARGTATVQLTLAGIKGPAVPINIQ
ncbi:MAG: hypothetical protein EXQ56_03305 [Acidobacteria bacterium]|nr:hypothetical protein [Acidobacteriota bacterium]